jgi:hypothetical protein
VNDQLDAARLHRFQHAVKVDHRAELGHHLAVVPDVVPVVGIGTVEVRAEPHDVNTEPLQVIELGGKAVEVADAVAVAIVERARGRLGIRRPLSTRRRGG